MLKTLVARAGFKDLWESAQTGTTNKTEALAAVPAEVSHMHLDALFERPVQTRLVELLLSPKDDRRFTSCVLVHGMGGTGKTVTAVAAVQDTSVRRFFSELYWLTIGADAVGERILALQSVLYKSITGKSLTSKDKTEHEHHSLLVEAMSEKDQALMVLDDPWMPEQGHIC